MKKIELQKNQQLNQPQSQKLFDELDKHISAEFRKLRAELLAEIEEQMSRRLAVFEQKIMTLITAEKKNTEVIVSDTVNKQLAVTNNNQLAKTKQIIMEMTKLTIDQTTAKVITHINKEFVPRFNNLAEKVAYHTEDSSELLDNYRRGVNDAINEGQNSNRGQITDGKTTKTSWADGNISLFFDEDQ